MSGDRVTKEDLNVLKHLVEELQIQCNVSLAMEMSITKAQIDAKIDKIRKTLEALTKG